MKRANLVGKDTFAEQKVLIKAYLTQQYLS